MNYILNAFEFFYLSPGVIRTPMLNNGDLNEQKFEQFCKEKYPLRRIGEPEDVAQVIVFLCSESASFISVSIVTVDGRSLYDEPLIKL
jgi:NAD(P)-dependent dehydrogenase (short-subunit alcohol dehydrogenase family)